MSLINDALKRANEQKAKQVTAEELGSTMQIVEARSDDTKVWPIALFAILLVGALWLGWSGLHSSSSSTPTAAASPTEVNARGPASENSLAANEPAATAEQPATPSNPPAGSELAASTAEAPRTAELPSNRSISPPEVPRSLPTAPAAAGLPPVVANAPAVTKPDPALTPPSGPPPAAATPPGPAVQKANTFPQLTLQGIYYRPARPSAVINSKTVYVGDRVQQAKILAIDRHEVTVQWNNEVHVLAFR